MSSSSQQPRKPYAKPKLVRHKNVKALTFECSNWQCSVTVPPGP